MADYPETCPPEVWAVLKMYAEQGFNLVYTYGDDCGSCSQPLSGSTVHLKNLLRAYRAKEVLEDA